MALNTNWMRRTGWAQTFAGADRKLLVRLAQMPQVADQGLFLDTYNNTNLHSCKQNEQRLVLMVAALDRVFDLCEDAIDESACNERTGDRKYGWGPVGRSVELEYSMKRSER
jgi:hypothetical protein